MNQNRQIPQSGTPPTLHHATSYLVTDTHTYTHTHTTCTGILQPRVGYALRGAVPGSYAWRRTWLDILLHPHTATTHTLPLHTHTHAHTHMVGDVAPMSARSTRMVR